MKRGLMRRKMGWVCGQLIWLRTHPLHVVWVRMLSRCLRPKDGRWADYGGRGISICQAWREDEAFFINWAINNGWEIGLEIDRENNNGSYEPTNCRFTTAAEEARNRRTSKLTHDQVREIRVRRLSGERGVDLASEFGVQPNIICGIHKNRIWKGVY